MNNIKEFETMTWCHYYIQYVILRMKGKKKESMQALQRFCCDFMIQSKDNKRKFIVLLNETIYKYKDYNIYLPYNLNREIIDPEIRCWIAEEPFNPIPLIWTRELSNLKIALMLDSYNQIALEMLGQIIINQASMNQHELQLNHPYQGDPINDIKNIDFFRHYLNNITDLNKRNDFQVQLRKLREIAMVELRAI